MLKRICNAFGLAYTLVTAAAFSYWVANGHHIGTELFWFTVMGVTAYLAWGAHKEQEND